MSKTMSEVVKEEHDEELAKLEAELSKLTDTSAEEKTSEEAATTSEQKQSEEEQKTQTKEEKSDGTKSTEAESEELSEDEVKQLSQKAQKRFQHFSKKNAELERELSFLRKSQPKPEPVKPQVNPLPWERDGGKDVERIAEEKARETVENTLRTERILNTIREDAVEVEAKYPELNPKSPEFDRVLLAKVSTWFKAQFKENNTLRLKDFVNDVLELRAQGIEKGRQEIGRTIAKQASEQALTPGGNTSTATEEVSSKIAKATSMKELEALESLF